MVGKLLQINGWPPNISLEKLNELILEKKPELVRNKIDVYLFNKKFQQVKKILLLRNNFLILNFMFLDRQKSNLSSYRHVFLVLNLHQLGFIIYNFNF